MHNVLFGQYLFLATEQGEINTTHPNYDIIQHILIPACSVARKTPFMQFFLYFSEFHTLNFIPESISGEFYPCISYMGKKYTPVSATWVKIFPCVIQSDEVRLTQGDNYTPVSATGV